jgi:chromosome partitioning protein
MHREIAGEVHNFFGPLLFDAYVRQNVSLTEAGSLGASIFAYDAASNGARDYQQVALEFLRRCDIYD